MGIFARWPLFEKPEVVLERRLQRNPVYPFQKETSESSTGTGVCLVSCPHPFRKNREGLGLGVGTRLVFVLLCHAWAWFMDLCNVTTCSSSYGLRLHQIRKIRISLLLTGRTSVAHIIIQIYSKASVMQGIIYYLWFMWPCPMILLQCTRTLHSSKGSTLPWAPPWPLYCSSSSGHQQVEIMWAT